MDKQQLKEDVGKLNLVVTEFEADGMCYMDRAVNVTQVYDLIDQLDEPEKDEPLVVPKYVADWIEDIKPYNSLRVAFEYIAQRKVDNHDDPLALWVEEGNSETFARAWLDGYEVEE